MSSSYFYEWLFGTENLSGLSRNARQVLISRHLRIVLNKCSGVVVDTGILTLLDENVVHVELSVTAPHSLSRCYFGFFSLHLNVASCSRLR